MGFHICEWCHKDATSAAQHSFTPYSSADVVLRFASGRSWQLPHTGLLHYVTSHGFAPPQEFIEDVMNSQLINGQPEAFRARVRQVGYLTLDTGLSVGAVPAGFVEKLNLLIEQVRAGGSLDFCQTRGGQ